MSKDKIFTDGLLILVESNEKNKWFLAKKWQSKKFIEVMRFGSMKSMGSPNPLTESEIFSHNGYNYQFEIHNDWGPCYINNISTNKKRQITYHNIGNNDKYNLCEIK
jgi:hypothetical protein